MISVVTSELVAIAIVETASPCSLEASTCASSIALSAQGTLRFVRFPVTNPRYDPPVPSIGT